RNNERTAAHVRALVQPRCPRTGTSTDRDNSGKLTHSANPPCAHRVYVRNGDPPQSFFDFPYEVEPHERAPGRRWPPQAEKIGSLQKTTFSTGTSKSFTQRMAPVSSKAL